MTTRANQKIGREHSVMPMAELDRRIAKGWGSQRGCRHYEDRTDWREPLCPFCKATS